MTMHPWLFLGICLWIATAIGFAWSSYVDGHMTKAGVNATVAVLLTGYVAYEVR